MLFLEEEILLWAVEWFVDEGYNSEEMDEEEWTEEEDDEDFISGESSDEEEWVIEMEEWVEARRWTDLRWEFADGLEWYFEEEEWMKSSENFLRGFSFFFES